MINQPTPLAAFSADVEDYFQVEALRDLCPRSHWETFEDRTQASTDRLLELLDRQGAKGTFFISGNGRQNGIRSWVKRIAGEGHEVASHGFDHELVYRQTPEEFRRDIRRARLLLQDLSQQEVIGYRAPSYTIVDRTRWALSILTEEGHRYDSSVFPIRRRRYGMPNAPRWPHRVTLDAGREIVEFPLPTVRLLFFNVPATGGAYLRLLPLGFQKWSVERMIRKSHPFVLTIHPWELDPDQPRLPVTARTRLTHYHNLGQAEDRLGSLLSLGRFRSLSQVLTDLKLL